ncbi:MAG: hypothetical protein WD076_02575, partial [Parvularculaceae bacterium]
MKPSFLVSLSLIFASTACGQKADPAAPVGVPPIVAEVQAADQFGAFDAPIKGLAFWAHPTLPYNGMLIAASEKGLVAFNMEDGEEVSRADGVPATGVSVSYTGAGAAAQGFAAVSMAGVDGGPGDIGFFAIDNATRGLTSLSSQRVGGGKDDQGFCLGRNEAGDRLVLHRMRAKGWSSQTIGGDSSAETKSASFRGGFVACVADDVDRAVFAVTAAGDIYRIGADGAVGKSPLARSGVSNPAGIGLSLSGLVDGGPTEECCGYLYVLNGADASVHVFDRDDGRAVGAIKLAASFDVDGVSVATTLGVGQGNFGAVYRDGALALATNGAAPHVRLAPLNAVMSALSAPLGAPITLRALGGQDEEEPVLDIK